MAEKTCSLCGEEMTYDDFTSAWLCPTCGNSIREKRTESVSDFTPAETSFGSPAEAAFGSPAEAALGEPEAPSALETLEVPEVASALETPEVPEVASAPETPKTPEAPIAPETSEVQEAPKAQSANEQGIPSFAFPRTDEAANKKAAARHAKEQEPEEEYPQRNAPGKDTVLKAQAAVANKNFEEALEIISDLKKKNWQIAKTYILTLFCGHQATSTEEMLYKLSTSSFALQKLADRADWLELLYALPADHRRYVKDIIEYCALTIVLSGDAEKILNNARRRTTPRNYSISRYDAEEKHYMERSAQLKKARNPDKAPTMEELYYDYEKRFNYSEPSIYSRDTGYNLAVDILEFLLFDDRTYSQKTRPILSRTREAREREAADMRSITASGRSAKSGAKQAAPASTKGVLVTTLDRLVKSGIGPEEIESRRAQLMSDIRDLELQIFDY